MLDGQVWQVPASGRPAQRGRYRSCAVCRRDPLCPHPKIAVPAGLDVTALGALLDTADRRSRAHPGGADRRTLPAAEGAQRQGSDPAIPAAGRGAVARSGRVRSRQCPGHSGRLPLSGVLFGGQCARMAFSFSCRRSALRRPCARAGHRAGASECWMASRNSRSNSCPVDGIKSLFRDAALRLSCSP